MVRLACRAQTKQGAACRAFARPGASYCLSHDPAMVEQARAARSRGGKVKALQGRYRKLESPEALLGFLSRLMQDVLRGQLEVDLLRGIAYTASVQRSLIETSTLSEIVRRLDALEVQLYTQPSRRSRWA